MVMCGAGRSDQSFSNSQARPYIGVVQQGGLRGKSQPRIGLHAVCLTNNNLQSLSNPLASCDAWWARLQGRSNVWWRAVQIKGAALT